MEVAREISQLGARIEDVESRNTPKILRKILSESSETSDDMQVILYNPN